MLVSCGGGVQTGDLGMMTQGGGGIPLLKITGRMKELYKLEV